MQDHSVATDVTELPSTRRWSGIWGGMAGFTTSGPVAGLLVFVSQGFWIRVRDAGGVFVSPDLLGLTLYELHKS